jgi:carboxyl-terminal processing protease
MDLKKGICSAGLVFVICVQPGIGQDARYAQMPRSSDPFLLEPGSSFSASGTRTARGGSAIGRAAISADLDEALSIIAANHVDGKRLNTDALTGSAITSMLHGLDPHSNYYDPDEFQELLGEHESEYSGTGSSIAGFEEDGRLETFVVSTFPDSPAARAGLRFGDRIVAVNNRAVSGESPDVVRDLVRGKRGTGVRVTVERADSRGLETIYMTRDRVHEPAVPRGFLLGGNAGYIDLTNGFSNATFGEFETALNDLIRQGMTSLILDIRGNGGGILEQAVKVAEKFLPMGTTIVSQRGRYSDDSRVWKASKPKHEAMPLVLLVDENSASASEVLAGALQDNDRALIIGRKTFGKGLVQSVLNLPEGAGLTLTAARYYTPTGRSIQRDYAATGLYDYYNHRTAEIDKPVFAAKTITNRVMYGGDGIAPDEIAIEDELTAQRVRLLDPIFFFSRDLVAGRLALDGPLAGSNTAQTLRQRIIFSEPVVDDQLIKQFDEFIAKTSAWARLRPAIGKETPFVSRMLGYYLAIGAFGTEAANRARIEADPQIRQAANALPRSAQLAAAAQRMRGTAARKEKSSLSLVLNEQR